MPSRHFLFLGGLILSKVKDGNYIVVQSFMVSELKLKGNELLVYAIIYGFSQDGEQEFTGSLQYLADWTNSTKPGVSKNLNSLIEKKLIVKNESFVNGVKFCSYRVSELHSIKQSLMGYTTEFNGGMQQSLTNNIYDNKEDITDNKKKTVTDVIAEYTDDAELSEALMEFAKMRKSIKKPLTLRAMQLLFNKLDSMAKTDKDKTDIVNQSIMNNWQGVFPLKDTQATRHVNQIDHHEPNYDTDSYRSRAQDPTNYEYKKKS